MAELNLKQIIDSLNKEFTGDTRKLVFWYDDKAQFVDDIDSIVLDNAKIYHLEKDNQFYTKRFLEKEDTTTNYLIYAPFPKPDVIDNHLEDTLLYSKRFYADKASFLSVDLGIKEKYKPIIEKHIKFFDSKERTQRFYDLEIENFNSENILVGMFASICHTKTCSFEEVIRVMMTEDSLLENKYLDEIEKYDLLPAFWELCEQHFGYNDPTPSLDRLLITMFVTATERQMTSDVPKAWKPFVSYKSGNILAFLDNLANNVLYRDAYDELASHIEQELNVSSALSNYLPESFVGCDTFIVFDNKLVKWLLERLEAEDINAKLNGCDISDICDKRIKMHYGRKTEKIYYLLSSAYQIIKAANYKCPDVFADIIAQYINQDSFIDTEYRKFYFYFDQLEDINAFEGLKSLIEKIYTNEYLATLLPKWNANIMDSNNWSSVPLQKQFFNKRLSGAKERTVVIISDALRYEVGYELFKKLQDDPKSTVKIDAQLSVLPSYTQLGMASLLPHKSLEITDDYKVLTDGYACDSKIDRMKILQSYEPESICLDYEHDKLKTCKKNEMRDWFTGKQIIYIYHNQIDARGDKVDTEDEVFVACEEAIQEIIDLIKKISTNANTYKFIITADHGFIYKREKIPESDKIGGVSGKTAYINRRFIISKTPVLEDGVQSLDLKTILGNEDDKVISFPTSSNVFKVSGGGQNFVHGGSSPQEMLIPVIDVKMDRYHADTRNVQISLVSMIQKITNLITTMDFIQSDPISDFVKATTYKLYFISEDNEKISNENLYVADSRDTDASKRIFRMKFTFKNKKYDKDKQYYLVAFDETTGLESFRHPVIMDIAFADDYGFFS